MNNPSAAKRWYKDSNSVIVLEADNAEALYNLNLDAAKHGLQTTVFREPDLADELTAIAFPPNSGNRKFLSNLPLAGKKLHNQGLLHDRERRLRKLSFAMMDAQWDKHENLLQNARSTREYYFALAAHLRGEVDLNTKSNWVVPEWLNTNRERILKELPEEYVMDRYLTLYTCSLSEVDSDGIRVPSASVTEASAEKYADVYREEALSDVQELIAHDLDVALMLDSQIECFKENKFASAHLLAAIAKATSDATNHGGVGTPVFRNQMTHIDKIASHVYNGSLGESK